jgi:hypothetical protein
MPDSIAGIYEIDMELLIMKPILVPNNTPSHYYLEAIRFENGDGIARFSNGHTRTLNVKFDEQDFSYSFDYRETRYVFQIRASLAGISPLVDVNILYDFTRL